MSAHATILGIKDGKASSISTGSPAKLRTEFKHGSFEGYDRVIYLDTSGNRRRKRGAINSSPKKAKATGKKASE